ncbi:MAG: hypothetical protein L0216_21205 [Planctomycetales bacterium]|nr:hypothetical protein [Planctomycetales bacterium]
MSTYRATAMAFAAGAVLGAAAGAARAQEAPKEESLGWMERMVLDQMSQRLDLTSEQKTKVEALVRESARRRKEIDEESAKRIRELLTDDQKPKFDELREWGRRWGGRGGGFAGGGGGAGGGFGGGGGGGESPQLKELAEKLSLTEDQQQKVREITTGAQDKAGTRIREVWQKVQKGEMDIGDIPGEIEKLFGEVSNQIRAVLTEEQKPKFDTWWKDLREQMADPSQWGRLAQRFGGGGQRGGSGSGGGNWGGWRGQDPDDPGLVGRILADLKLSEDELVVLRPAIEKILAHDRAQRRAVRERAPKLRAAASSGDSETAKAALADARKADADARGKREEMEGELRDLVTVAQEAVLVSHGVLR